MNLEGDANTYSPAVRRGSRDRAACAATSWGTALHGKAPLPISLQRAHRKSAFSDEKFDETNQAPAIPKHMSRVVGDGVRIQAPHRCLASCADSEQQHCCRITFPRMFSWPLENSTCTAVG